VSPSLPGRVGRYEVVALIGTGAFATVFQARDDRLDADVALKVLAENHSFDPEIRGRFITEGHLLRRVDSPHVVSVFDLGETDAGQPFLVLDLATGGDLGTRRRSLGPPGGDGAVAGRHILRVAEQVALALGALHAEQVVHRDVSPGNLLIRSGQHPTSTTAGGGLLRPGERLMLADLGLSKDLAQASGLTVGAGTAGFTPPEQGEGGWVDARADIWSASALLVWLALGRGPGDDHSWRRELLDLGWLPPMVDELARGLAPEAEERHPTAAVWAAALRTAADPPVAVSTSGPWAPMAEGPPKVPVGTGASAPSRRRSAIKAAMAVAAAVLLVAGGWWLADGTGGSDGTVETTRTLADGQVQVTASAGDLRVSATGPEILRVGEAGTFTAEVDGAAHYVWLAPDGTPYTDVATLVVLPSSPGVTTVRLVGLDGDGDMVSAQRAVRVRATS